MLCRLQKPCLSGSRPVRTANCSFRPLKISGVIPRASASAAVSNKEDDVEPSSTKAGVEAAFEHDVPDPKVSSKQVATFLSTLVEHTDIAELHLQVGSFDLKVRRSLASTPAPQASYPTPIPTSAPLNSMGSVDFSSVSTAESLPTVESMDESLVYVTSPKVGIFCRGKYAGGKRLGKGNMVNVGDQVKKGQPLGYVEQLGTHFPIESPQAGEISKFMLEDGAPVEYQQVVVEIAPFFGGHIIGDMKHA